ncbi:YheC/YheD family protein [Paenibacillus planticolens]|uniref:ATP-grasp domain-containing protein n=1 Tax=Paenibacillus planticolens TaxID=2654976 RepID=A0ABX1ZU31_9BACL|nr:YheC/YheD family protein [Paenibacillus planticolens]NOV02328.1 hypothetical protein [Paenibacillus planticolens]
MTAYSYGKWPKYKVLVKSRRLIPHLPKTLIMGHKNFSKLLDKFKKIIIKPSGGSGGKGVIQVTSLGKGIYMVHDGRFMKRIVGREAAYSFVHARTKSTTHIVQKKIPLAQVNGRPFDLRVVLQKSTNSSWHITGKLAKIAGPGYIITNTARSKGKVVPLSSAIHASTISDPSLHQINKKIDHISNRAVQCLNNHYPKLRIVGLDIGLDSNGKVWIIEANFAPSKSLFLRLKDKTMYKRILSYARMKLK